MEGLDFWIYVVFILISTLNKITAWIQKGIKDVWYFIGGVIVIIAYIWFLIYGFFFFKI